MHEQWMKIAYDLAASSLGQTSPDPVVGAVVVKEGRLLGSGVRSQPGGQHAEEYALQMASEQAQGATLYTTLEPCQHEQKPDCIEQIISSGIRQVVIAMLEPDSPMAGRSVAHLREAGIEVIHPMLEAKCQRLNEAYFYFRKTGQPWVTIKTANTLDGKVATTSGDSRWVTGKESRQMVHQLRHQSDAILVGIGTVLADNPQLTTRLPAGGKNPLRVILDSRLRTPIDAAVVDTDQAPTWIFTSQQANEEKKQQLQSKGVRVITTNRWSNVDVLTVLDELGKQGITSLLVEGGGEVNASFLSGGYVQKWIAFIAPKLLGGRASPTSIEGANPERMAQSWSLKSMEVQQIGEDLCCIGYL